jgi:hypothetical protein
MPARPRTSELREALDAAQGTGRPEDYGDLIIPGETRWRVLVRKATPASRWALGAIWTLISLTVAGVLSLVIYGTWFQH